MHRPQWLWPEYEGQSQRLIIKRLCIALYIRFRLLLMTPKQRARFHEKVNRRLVFELQRQFMPLYVSIPRKTWDTPIYPFHSILKEFNKEEDRR